MKKLILGIGLGLVVAFTSQAQEWAKAKLEKSPRHGEWVKIKQGKREVESFITYPEVKEKATAVVVIHEIFGLSDWARSVTDELAEAGYIAIAPDLLSGLGPKGGGTSELGGSDGVRKAIFSLPPDQITADLNAAVDYVSKLPSCNGKVLVMGFCWGGGQSFRFATNNKEIKGAMVFYGTGPEDEKDIKRISCPVYGFYGGNDARVTSTVEPTKALMKKAGKRFEPVIYEGAGHGFMRAGEAPDVSEGNKKARDEAWKRVKEILKKS
ncbi:dienelactone hydrolase family protein [Pedosphaera parvula]|uniref:Dienelactone hydrolase n=1 Tax=Pedosphaera parvula (strain Ellin514) TaxID=320771 RepID=B9X9Q3_PEDPL|nr:dienelactone hydrolase family protein [Pedosphaera parvula]EEF63201.1 dienelactone hydrolase [Pedosphaera parvula Ellin514]